jgi:hypothetical protein
MYKSHLMSITGSLDLSSATTLTASNGNNILNYLPNISSVTFEDNLNLLTLSSTDFENMEELASVNMSGCTGLNGQTLDLSNNIKVTTVDTSGTTINVILPSNDSPITTYSVGSPTSISITNPTSLTASGVTIESSANLTSLELVNVNGSSNVGFNIFGKIMGL